MKQIEIDHIKLLTKLNKKYTWVEISRRTGICNHTLTRLRNDPLVDWRKSTINKLIALYNSA